MSDLPKLPPLATGGMSTSGTTTVVRIAQPKIDPIDKKILCSAMCDCEKDPKIGKDGRELKQACVADRMKTLDGILLNKSPYKQELNYDMTKEPPAPIMDSRIATKGHDWLPGWVKKYWDKDPDHPEFQAGTGQIRRPDVVIVNDPAKPPTQDNIKQIVEMKFPPDTISEQQRAAYIEIGGGAKKLVTLQPSDCDCSSDEPTASKVPVDALAWATAALAWLLYAGSRGKTPRPPIPAF